MRQRQLVCEHDVLFKGRVGAKVVHSLVANAELGGHEGRQLDVLVQLFRCEAYHAAQATQIYFAIIGYQRRVVVEVVVEQQAVIAVVAQLLGGGVVVDQAFISGKPQATLMVFGYTEDRRANVVATHHKAFHLVIGTVVTIGATTLRSDPDGAFAVFKHRESYI